MSKKRYSNLFNKTLFCSAKCKSVQQGFVICSTKPGFVQQNWNCSTNSFLFSKLFNKTLFGMRFCSAKVCFVHVFVQPNTRICSTNLGFVEQFCVLLNRFLYSVEQFQNLFSSSNMFNKNLYRGGATLRPP